VPDRVSGEHRLKMRTRPSSSGKAFADKATDLQALRDTVADAGNVGAGLWLSYVFVLLYLAIAAGGVTHRDLLLVNPVKLPFLNVELSLNDFFVWGPVLLLIVHAYVLLHLVRLAGKSGAFQAELRRKIPGEQRRGQLLLSQLPSNILVQFLARPDDPAAVRVVQWLIAQVSLVFLPVIVLVLFQLKFLPYHDQTISTWQRIAVFIDVALLWTLWFRVTRGETTLLRWRIIWRRKSTWGWGLLSLIPLLLVFFVATFPNEWLDNIAPRVGVVPNKWLPWKEGDSAQGRSSLHELLVAGDVELTGKLASLWSNRLVLPNLNIVDNEKFDTETKLAAVPQTLSLRGRHLEGAVLPSARLRKVDFTGAHLQRATLAGADLREAKFGSISGPSADLRDAQLVGAQLQGAVLDGVTLWGAWLPGAQLQGASLDWAKLQGANLSRADLEGASLRFAHLGGASLDDAQLQAASLDGAELQGASLRVAELEGASLAGATLQGALFDDAVLQGVSLAGADLLGASFSRAFVWRADARNIKNKDVFVVAPETQPKDRGSVCPNYQAEPGILFYTGAIAIPSRSFAATKSSIERQFPSEIRDLRLKQICPDYREGASDWSVESFAALKSQIESQVPTAARERALKRIANLDPSKPLAGEEAMTETWNAFARSPPTPAVYDQIAQTFVNVGCDVDSGSHVITGLLFQVPWFAQLGCSEAAVVAATFLDEAHCPAARDLLEDFQKSMLRQIRDTPRCPPAAKKPCCGTTPPLRHFSSLLFTLRDPEILESRRRHVDGSLRRRRPYLAALT
jgi:uncharacterized protein YjbI with pentapeptide repeats